MSGVGAQVGSRSDGLLGPRQLLLLVQDPGMGLVEQLTEREDFILMVGIARIAVPFHIFNRWASGVE